MKRKRLLIVDLFLPTDRSIRHDSSSLWSRKKATKFLGQVESIGVACSGACFSFERGVNNWVDVLDELAESLSESNSPAKTNEAETPIGSFIGDLSLSA